MPALREIDRRLVDELRNDGVQGRAQADLRARQVDLREDLDVRLDLRDVVADQAGKLAEDACDLVLFRNPQRANAVVDLDGPERLDEERLPARARVVHDSRKLTAELGLDRDDEPAGTDRDDRLLQHFRKASGTRDRRRPLARFRFGLRCAAAQTCQLRRRAIANNASLVDRVGDARDELGQRPVRSDDTPQHLGLGFEDTPDGGSRSGQRFRNRAQLAGIQARAEARARGRFRRLTDPRQHERLGVRQLGHLARRGHPQPDGLEIERRDERAGTFRGAIARGLARQTLANLREIELR